LTFAASSRRRLQRDEWLVSRRYLSAESMAVILHDPHVEQGTLAQPAEQEVDSLVSG
jgi:hypothetical protein